MHPRKSKIPQPFFAILITASALLVVVSVASILIAGSRFGIETAITGAFSVALLYVYVVWYTRVMMRADAQIARATEEEAQEIAQQSAIRLQIGSLVRFFILSVFLIVSIVVFNFDAIADMIGVTVMFLPLSIVPLFVKSSSSDQPESSSPEDEDSSEVEKQC
ncbi:MAG: hypothetical protein IKY83_02740 [Proteobacteria bacterium]|nr:hypothetical protein [Pseudomonadota bacterium]